MRSRLRNKGILFIISGPSGSGKTTLAERLLTSNRLKSMLVKSCSLTTRPRRSAERHNRDYLFVERKEFLRQLRCEKILEWTNYLGYYYGTPKGFINRQLRRGKHLLLCLDLKGARRLKRLYPRDSVTIFVIPPSLKELKRRIAMRCHKASDQEIARRVQLARQELLAAAKYDYRVTNKDLRQALKKLEGIIRQEIKQRGGG